MIQAKEIRVGNWVEYFGKYYKLDSVTEKGTWINIDSGTSGVFWCELNPIPITEDVLLKCGFEYCNNGYYKYLIISEYNYLVISRTNTIYIADCPSVNGVNIELHEVESLHQLQNLYFALTNQELNIEL